MSRAMIHRQKIRTWQLVLLTVGGILIFWGYLLFEGKQHLTEGYHNLTKGFYEEALEAFKQDVSSNPERLESRFGLGLTLLHLDRGVEAEEQHAYIHEVLTEDRTPAPRHTVWAENNPRLWMRHKGHFYYFNAWIAGERMLRAFRIGEGTERINDLYSDYEKENAVFKGYVDGIEKHNRKAGPWGEAYKHMQDRITNADRNTDLSRGLAQLKDPKNLDQNTSAQINKALPFIERTLKEAKETHKKIPSRAWHLLLVTQLSRRAAGLHDGRGPVEALETSLRAAEKLEHLRNQAWEVDGYDGLKDIDRIRFLLAMADAAQNLTLHRKSEAGNLRGLKNKLIERVQNLLSDSPDINEEQRARFEAIKARLQE